MANGFDKDRAEEMIGLLRQTRTMVMVAAAASVLAAFGAVLIYSILHSALLQTSQGSEPPIRVKGGSLHFDLLAGFGSWKSKNGTDVDTDWTLEPGYRHGDDIRVLMSGTVPTADCPVLQTVKKVTFSYTSNNPEVTNEVTLHATGNKTTLKANFALTKQMDGSLVFDKDNHGYISALKGVGGGPPISCTFKDANALGDVIATEP